MAQNPGDDKTEPSLELPSLKLPGFRRRKKDKEPGKRRNGSTPDAGPVTAEPAGVAPADRTSELTQPIPREAEPQPVPEPEPLSEPEPVPVPEPEPQPVPEPETEVVRPRRKAKRDRTKRRERRPRPKFTGYSLPSVSGWTAAAVTGVVVAIAGGIGTYAAMAACEVVRGVSTCGGAPGFFILVAIVVLMILLGAVLLKAFRVSDPNSTSFLAVGVMAVVVMLTLLDVIYSPWMFVLIPILGALSYLLSHWVTTRFEEETTGRRREWM